jgi:hypothetical protein
MYEQKLLQNPCLRLLCFPNSFNLIPRTKNFLKGSTLLHTVPHTCLFVQLLPAAACCFICSMNSWFIS